MVIGIRHHGTAVVDHSVQEYRLILDVAEIFRLGKHRDDVIDVRSLLNITLKYFAAVLDLDIESRELPAPGKRRTVVDPLAAVVRCQGAANILHESVDITLVYIRTDNDPGRRSALFYES